VIFVVIIKEFVVIIKAIFYHRLLERKESDTWRCL